MGMYFKKLVLKQSISFVKKKEKVLLKIKLLDGINKNIRHVEDIYKVKQADTNLEYDYILVSVSSNKLESVIKTLNDNNISGTILLFNGIWQNRIQVEDILEITKALKETIISIR